MKGAVFVSTYGSGSRTSFFFRSNWSLEIILEGRNGEGTVGKKHTCTQSDSFSVCFSLLADSWQLFKYKTPEKKGLETHRVGMWTVPPCASNHF